MLWRKTSAALLLCVAAVGQAETLGEQREKLLQTLAHTHQLTAQQLADIEAIFARSRVIGQGNPAVTRHPATRAQCRQKLQRAGIDYNSKDSEAMCGDKYMVPLYDPETATAQTARACIDQFEFPNIPCEYPVVWVRAKEAAEICNALGKRLCDTHEWEGACEGQLLAPDYPFDAAVGKSAASGLKAMRAHHNQRWASARRWSYGDTRRKGICAMDSHKSGGCNGGDWARCGSNTYPAGMFPDCGSDLGAYDFHGNAAEHMNLPRTRDQLASSGSQQLGYTEMKGSWFIWDTLQAHPDWCRWRAPFWHGSKVTSEKSHRNYHLSFRCCKSRSSGD